MEQIWTWIKTEPSAVLGALQALLALAIGFGLPITTTQMGLVLAASAAVFAVINRQSTTSNETLKGTTNGSD